MASAALILLIVSSCAAAHSASELRSPSSTPAGTVAPTRTPVRSGSECETDSVGLVPCTEKAAEGCEKFAIAVGRRFLDRKEYLQAVAALTEALRVRADAEAFYYRGLCWLGMKQQADAKTDLRNALALEPDGPNAEHICELLKVLS